ncbi:MAG: stealth family protein [Treponema sp.]|nr:stealth family protein [Treponema sp.]
MKIDAVYTWCDDSDPEFIRQRNEVASSLGIQLKNNKQTDFSRRYKNNDELKYSLRSIEKYAPWINHIFIVVNNNAPKWLRENNRITIIHHTDIIPKSLLPTFNSNVIEQYLTEIPGLSDSFLFFNDDFFLNRKVGPKDFFDLQTNKPIVRLQKKKDYFGLNDDWGYMVKNGYELIYKKYGYFVAPRLCSHSVEAFSKSMLKEILQNHPETYRNNISPFRSKSDIQRTFWEIEKWLINDCQMKEVFITKSKVKKLMTFIFHLRNNYVYEFQANNNVKDFKNSIRGINHLHPLTICFNDLTGEVAELAVKWFEKKFPKKSSFEH